jgi:phospholysine phosphohistidine inorganic pyrophosphate phosphatase
MSEIQGLIFDIDGVLEFQGSVYPGAVETLAWLRSKGLLIHFLTNSTLKSRQSCTMKLRRSGFQAEENEVITASYAAAVYLRSLHPRSCWVMVERAGLDEFKDFVIDDQSPEYLVVGDNRSRFDFDHLNHAVRLLLRGARLIAMQGEQLDTSMGEVELNVGAWTSMLERASGVPAVYLGKPNRYNFDLALDSMGLGKHQVVVVGDRVQTDIQGARNAGLRSILVRTGEFDPSELGGAVQPDWICDALRDLPAVIFAE